MHNEQISYKSYVENVKKQVIEISVESYFQAQSEYPVLIDVREEHEHQTGVLPGAQLIPRGMLEGKLTDLIICQDKLQPLDWLAEQNILLYCRTGARSALAAHSLQQMGFSKVFSLAGGCIEWSKQGYPLTTKEN